MNKQKSYFVTEAWTAHVMTGILLPHQLQWNSSYSFEITHLGLGLQISNQAAVNKKSSEEKKASLQRGLSPTSFPGAKKTA